MRTSFPKTTCTVSEALDIVGFSVSGEEFRKWLDPDSDAYSSERGAHLRHMSACRELLAALQYGYVRSWVITNSGSRIDAPEHWWIRPMQVSVGALMSKDWRALLKMRADEVCPIDRSRSFFLPEITKRLSSVQPVDATAFKPARQKDRPQWKCGGLYLDQMALIARLSETPEQSSPSHFIDSQGDVSVPAAHPASTATGKVRRSSDLHKEAELKLRIEFVLARARREWRGPKSRPGVRPMARELVRLHGDMLGYRFDTVRKILDGTYSVSQRLGISGL